MIRKAIDSDINSIVDIHKNYLRSLVQGFEYDFLKNFYEKLLQNPKNFVFVGIENDSVTGFLVGTTDIKNFFSAIFKQAPFYFYRKLLFYFILHPKNFLDLFLSKFVNNKKYSSNNHLVYICVDPNFRNRNIASGLLIRFEKEMSNNNFDCYELEVEAKNSSALNFYSKNNFDVNHKFKTITGLKCILSKRIGTEI